MHVVVDSHDKDKGIDETDKESDTIRGVLRRFAGETSAHGIPRIIQRPHYLSKLCWFVLVVAAFFVFFLQTSRLLQNFYTFNTKIQLIQSEEVIFPAITICNLNRMKKSLMAKNERWKDTVMLDNGYKFQIINPTNPTPMNSPSSAPLMQSEDGGNVGIRNKRETGEYSSDDSFSSYWYYDSSSSESEASGDFDFQPFPSGDNFSLPESTAVMPEKLKAAQNPTRQELKQMGHSAEDFIVECKFNNRMCDHNDFYVIQNENYGNCFTFNHGGGRARVTKAGSSCGLHLTLFVEHYEYVGILTEESGVRLIVHERDVFPYPEDVGMSLPPGFSTSIGIRKVEIKRLPSPYGNCFKPGGHHNYLHSKTHAYSILSCQKKCLLDEMARRCNCVSGIYEEYGNMSQCVSDKRKCRQGVEKEFYLNEMECSCPASCQEYLYSTRETSSVWPSKTYHRHLKEKLGKNKKLLPALENITTARENLMRLKIYFEELDYELVEQTPTHTIESVSGTIGGLLGLYVGFSLMTVIEFVALIYDVVVQVVNIKYCK